MTKMQTPKRSLTRVSEKQSTRCVGTAHTRCPETIDIEELLEWMLRYPGCHPDNNFLYDTKDNSNTRKEA